MIDRDEIQATQARWDEASARGRRFTGRAAGFGLLSILVLSIPAALLADTLASPPLRYVLMPVLLALFLGPVVFVLSKAGTRVVEVTDGAMDELQGQLRHALEEAEQQARSRELQSQRQEFETQLNNALEMADGETEVIEVVQRAFTATLPQSPVELLLADNSHAHLSRMAEASPTSEPPRCTVDSPDRCPAARRAQTQHFRDSEDLDACPKLRGRERGACSAVCVPVSIMGRTVGVIHATGEPGATFGKSEVADLGILANLAGARIGLLRIMAETQLQAATDSLTGLLNRRSLENRTRQVREDGGDSTAVMADLDHFKLLNDTHGHETGDRALRTFSQVLRQTLRSHDIISRYGGEEFAIILPGCRPTDAVSALEQVRSALATAIEKAGLPRFTASFGAVEVGPDEEFATVLRRADAALYQAKRDGRDRIVVHDEHGGEVGRAPEPDPVRTTRPVPAPPRGEPSRVPAPVR